MSESKVVLVTGASRGIGQAVALSLGQQGYIVIGTATRDSGAADISAFFSEHAITGCGMQLDICDAANIDAVLKEVAQQYAAPNVLVNNAAITHDNIFLRMREQQWDSVINTSLSGVYRMTKAAMKAMVKARWGRVINIGSVVGSTGNPGQANYCAAKAGVVGMTKSLALEWAAHGITFNTVSPGFIDTDMTQSLNDKQKEAILNQIPMKMMGAREDVAHAVVFLASEQARYITGQTLHVNGGMYMC